VSGQTDLSEILKDSENGLRDISSEEITQSKSESLVLEDVLSYIKSKEGRLSVKDCADSLSMDTKEVLTAIDSLKEQGKLVIEREAE
jgi:DNA-binding MarR family transcriptional regulator